MFPLISGIGQTLSSLLTYYNGTTFPTFNYTYPSYPSYNFGYPGYYGAVSRPSSGLTVNILNSQQEQMKQSADVSNMNNNTVTESITASATAMAMAAGRRFLNNDPTDRPIMKNFIRKNNFLKPVVWFYIMYFVHITIVIVYMINFIIKLMFNSINTKNTEFVYVYVFKKPII